MSDEITRWLAANALPLNSLTAGAPTSDLEPLRHVLRDVRIPGLGEATHKSREFFQLKHRILEFLVNELEFTALDGGQRLGFAGCERLCPGRHR